MCKRFGVIVCVLAIVVGLNNTYAQSDVLRVLAIDYMGEALEAVGVYEMGFDIDMTVAHREEMGGVIQELRQDEFDIVLVDNQTMDPLLADLDQTIFIPVPPIQPLPLCEAFPWIPFCRDWCPPNVLCPLPILWDKPIIVDPWEPMPWTLDRLIEVVETEIVMVDPRNEIGFELQPEILNLASPNLTDNLDEAFLVFTPACNYVMHFDEFNSKGFLPIEVEGYQERPFNVGAYVVAEGNVELATEFASLLVNDPKVQMTLFETTGLLPRNFDVLTEILPQ